MCAEKIHVELKIHIFGPKSRLSSPKSWLFCRIGIFSVSILSIRNWCLECTYMSIQRPNSGTSLGQKSYEFSYLLFTVTSTNGFYPPPPLQQKWFETGWNVNIVNGNLKSENSQNYAQKPQWNRTLINSASVHDCSSVGYKDFTILMIQIHMKMFAKSKS